MSSVIRLRAPWPHLVVAVLSAAGVAVTFAAAVLTEQGQRAEQQVLAESQFTYTPPLLQLVTVPNLVIACAVILVVGLLRRRVLAPVIAITVVAASNVLGQVLKHMVLERPALDGQYDNTFPSGHMVAFASVLVGLIIVVPPLIRAAVAVLGTVGLVMVAGQLLQYGWHRPSDVVGAVLLVSALSALGLIAVSDRPGPLTVLVERLLGVVGIIAGLLAVTSVALSQTVLADTPLADAPIAGTLSPMLAAQLGTVAVVLVVVSVTLMLLRTRTRTRSGRR